MKVGMLVKVWKYLFVFILLLVLVRCVEDEEGLHYIGNGIKDVLNKKVSVHTIDVAPTPVEDKDGVGWGNAPHPQIILAVRPDNTMAVAWNNEDGSVHISDINADFQLNGSDIVIADRELGGFTLTPTGYGVTAVRDSMLFVISLNNDGTQQFETQLIGMKPHTVKGSKFDPMAFGSSRLHFADNRFAAYFSHQQNFSDDPNNTNNHQGDMLVFLDTQGEVISDAGGWNWGTSHSLDERLGYDGEVFVTVSLGDAYPKGITFQRVTKFRKKTILELDANMSGWANGDLGGLVVLDDIYVVAYLTPQGRDTTDAGLLFVNSDGEVTNQVWMTINSKYNTAFLNRVNAARYGTDIFIAWNFYSTLQNTDMTSIATVNTAGQIIYGPDLINETFNIGDDFATFPDGSVGWAIAEEGALKIVKVSM